VKIRVLYGRKDPSEAGACPKCDGGGWVPRQVGSVTGEQSCRRCQGAGQKYTGWTYQAPAGVKVGDIVLVPVNRCPPEETDATVIGVQSEFTGRVMDIIRIVETGT
jgi:hypothetical protein